jgi:hypothetical protein
MSAFLFEKKSLDIRPDSHIPFFRDSSKNGIHASGVLHRFLGLVHNGFGQPKV